MGKRKLLTTKIEDPSARRVCFAKRRSVINQKAEMLSKLCDTDTIFITFGPSGRPFLSTTIPSSPALDSLFRKFISDIQQIRTAATPSCSSSSNHQLQSNTENNQAMEQLKSQGGSQGGSSISLGTGLPLRITQLQPRI